MLKKRFGTSGTLKDFFLQHSSPNGSRLYAGIAQVLTYIQSLPGVREGDTKVCILVLSDMLDNSPSQDDDKKQMIDALKSYATIKGKIGFYFVNMQCLESTRQCLTEAGLDPRFIESAIAVLPAAPRNGNPVPWLTSLYHKAYAGPYGRRSYPGNCSGELIKDLLK